MCRQSADPLHVFASLKFRDQVWSLKLIQLRARLLVFAAAHESVSQGYQVLCFCAIHWIAAEGCGRTDGKDNTVSTFDCASQAGATGVTSMVRRLSAILNV